MRTKGLLVLIILGGAAAVSQAGPFSCKGDNDYSRWHYWAPGLYKLKNLHRSPHISAYASPGCDNTPAPIEVIRFPCPAVLPQDRYLGSDLPYDPAGRFMNQLPIRQPEKKANTPATETPKTGPDLSEPSVRDPLK